MSPSRYFFIIAGIALLISMPVQAAKKQPKPLKHLSALVEEVAAHGEISKEAH